MKINHFKSFIKKMLAGQWHIHFILSLIIGSGIGLIPIAYTISTHPTTFYIMTSIFFLIASYLFEKFFSKFVSIPDIIANMLGFIAGIILAVILG